MALLKGGTVVDGDLFVEDSIRANSIRDLNGKNFPYIDKVESTGYTDRVVRFSNDDSGLFPTNISIKDSADNTNISFPGQTVPDPDKLLTIDATPNNIMVKKKTLELDSNTSTWNFQK